MLKSISAWWQHNVWNRLPWRRNRDATDAASPQPAIPTPPDPDTPQPAPVPPPALLPVIDPARLSIWCEASPAYDLGINSAICWSLRGRAGAQNIRIAHPWYDPWRTRISYAEWVRRMQAAQAEGCIAFAIDSEGWMFTQAVVDEIWQAAQAVNMTLLHVPKATLGMGDPPTYWLDRDFEHSVQYLQSRSHGVWLWNYGFTGNGYRQCTQDWRNAGYTGQIGWITDQVRDHGGYQGARVWPSVVQAAREDNISFMLFLGNRSTSRQLTELREHYT